jgi:hypothetical protein
MMMADEKDIQNQRNHLLCLSKGNSLKLMRASLRKKESCQTAHQIRKTFHTRITDHVPLQVLIAIAGGGLAHMIPFL